MNKENPDNFEILRRIIQNPTATQRDLAKDLNLSLGKVNYCLKALKEKGYIKIKNFQKILIKLVIYIFLHLRV